MQATAISSLAPAAALLPAPNAAAPAPGGTAPPAGVSLPPTLEITYDFNRELRQIVFTLRRPDTGQVVRQVPPRAVLEFAAYIMRQPAATVDVKI